MAKGKVKRIIAAAVAAVCLIVAAVLFRDRGEPIVIPQIEGDMTITTDFCDLYYPARWEAFLEVRIRDNCVSFEADLEKRGTYPLFDICFGEAQGHRFDTILTSDGAETDVYVTVHSMPETAKLKGDALELLYAMQDGVNYLCGKLPVVTKEQPAVQQPDLEDLEISTPYGSLSYPGFWEPYLVTEVTDGAVYVINFFAEVGDHPRQQLFVVRIGPEIRGEYLMHRDEAGNLYTLALEYVPVEPDGTWTEAEMDILYSMAEAAERLVAGLETVDPAQIPAAKAELFETPYGVLCYPVGMQISCRETKADPYTVSFYGSVENGSEVPLYDVCFGNGIPNALGTVVGQNGNTVSVGVTVHNVKPDASWTQAQANAVYTMQDTANQVLDRLTLMEDITFADPEEAEFLRIQTPYGHLQYPGKWRDNVRISKTEGKHYVLRFYGHAGNIPEQLLFSIAFGGREGIEVATVADMEGKAVNVYLIPEEIEGEEGAAKDQLYAMAEGAIWVVESLEVPFDE